MTAQSATASATDPRVRRYATRLQSITEASIATIFATFLLLLPIYTLYHVLRTSQAGHLA
jgi:hypothetical protein